jgi:hypothetical protein
VTILHAGHDIQCMFTTPKLLEALALRLESMGTSIGRSASKEVFSGGTEFTPQWNRFAHEELLDGAFMTPTYGYTLMGLAPSAPSGRTTTNKISYYAPQPRAVVEVVTSTMRTSWSSTARPPGEVDDPDEGNSSCRGFSNGTKVKGNRRTRSIPGMESAGSGRTAALPRYDGRGLLTSTRFRIKVKIRIEAPCCICQ